MDILQQKPEDNRVINKVVSLEKELKENSCNSSVNESLDRFQYKYLQAEENCRLLGHSKLTMKHFRKPNLKQLKYAQTKLRRELKETLKKSDEIKWKILKISLLLENVKEKKEENEKHDLTNFFLSDIMSEYDHNDL